MSLKNFSCFLSVLLIILSCKKDVQPDPFLVTNHSIGFLTDSTQVKDLKTVFINDSITKYIGGDEFTGDINDIEVFEKGGNMLLALTPTEDLDSTSTIRTIRIIDARYKTLKGIQTSSSFKDIKDNYSISSIQNSMRNVIVSVDEINAYFTIAKDQLPMSLRNDMDIHIEASQIPDQAKIKDFYLLWY